MNTNLSEEQKNIENEKRLKTLDKKFEEIKERQESELTCDFDKALEEFSKEEESFTVRFLGKIYELPSSMPFNFSTFFLRYCYKKVDGKMVIVMPEDKILTFIKLMFGGEFLAALEQAKNPKINMKFISNKIVPIVMKQWGYDVNNENVKDLQKKISTRGL